MKMGSESFSHAEGSAKGFGVVLTQELEVLAILKAGGGRGGGRKSFHPTGEGR